MTERDSAAPGFLPMPYVRRSDETPAYEELLDTKALKDREVFRVGHDGQQLIFYDGAQMKDWLAHQPGWEVVQKVSGAKSEGALSLKSVDVHVTHACDHDCDHCFAFSSGPHLSVELFDKAQQLASALGIRTFQFCGGEPTLNPRMLAMAEMAKAQGFQIILRTHGRHLSQPVSGRDKRTWAQEIARIFDEEDEVTVSVDGLAWENFLIRACDKGKQEVFDLIRANERKGIEAIVTNQDERDVIKRHISNLMQERGYSRELEVPVRDIIEAIQGLRNPEEKERIIEEISNQANIQYNETMDGLEAQTKESARQKYSKVRINSVVARDNEAYSAFCLKNSSPRTAEMVVANVL
jgi:molybdenum cofactor biosynthesis enzyme MoaA